MNKIKRIELKNFRAFEGNEIFDLAGNYNTPADFVCIYGSNGMGKSSFIDGIEWIFTGKIDRLEKDKNIAIGYEGNILKNYNSVNQEKASIKVVFEDDEYIFKEANKYTNSKNDYSKSSIQPKKYRNVNFLGEEQILPHSKIEGFIQAKNPEQKYKEWGEIWDRSGEQRKFFNQIYQLRKICKNKVELLKNNFNENNNKLLELDISEELINELNIEIDKFNVCSNKKEIRLIRKVNGGKLILPSSHTISELKERELNVQDKLEKIRTKLQLLDKDINKFEKERKTLEILYSKKENYSKILEQCSLNRRIDTKLTKLASEYLEKDKNKIMLESVINAGEEWFNLYINQSKYKEDIDLIDSKVNIIKSELKNYEKERKENEESLSNVVADINSLLSKKEILLKYVQDIVICQDLKKQCELKRNNNIRVKLELENILKNKNKIIEQLKFLIINDQNQDLLFKDKSIDFESNREDIKSLIEQYKTKFIRIEEIYKRLIENKDEKQREYDIQKGNFNRLEILLTNIKQYIENNNISCCPVCKTSFEDMTKLVKQVDLSVEQECLFRLEKELNIIKDNLKKYKYQKENLIIEWNAKCNFMLEKEEIDKERLDFQLIGLLNKVKEYDKQIYNYNNKINEYKKFAVKSGYNETDYNNENIVLWYNQKKTEIDKQKSNIEYKKENNINLIKKQHSLLEEQQNKKQKILNSANEFLKNDNNIILQDIIKKFQNIKAFQDVFDVHELLKKDLLYIHKEIKKLESIKNSGVKVDLDKYDYYKNKINKINNDIILLETTGERYKERYREIFHNYSVSYKAIKRKITNVYEYLELVNKKISILNNLISQVDIVDYERKYNNLMKAKEILEIDLKKYENGFEYINELFLKLKKVLESNATEVLNGAIVNVIYKKIEPHKVFDSLKYELSFNKSDKPELYIISENSKNKKEISPQLFFSTAQLNTIALSIFLAGSLAIDNTKIKTIFIDDPIGHFDDINILAFVDVLRSIIREGKWQIIISTHDETFFNILQNKIPSTYYNSKFIKFSSVGRIEYIDK
ncbi:AAA family ATPase [Clostridium botulinum]|nr:AAA family ATPase [Clostridium botulinum]EKS4395277.1 AAA family ATPase [Clostridium botulinum]